MGKADINTGEPSPEKIFDTFFAFASTRVFVSGIDHEVFTHIANGHRTAVEIAKAASSSPRGMEILLNSLVCLDFITKSNGSYHLTPLAEKFLVKGRPAYFGDFVQHADLLWEPWSNLSEVDFGQNRYDLVILGHICHTEGAERTHKLFSRAHRSLKSGGKLLIADMIPDDERCKAVFPLLFAVNMLVHSAEGNTFTMAEYRQWLKEAGFTDVTTIDAPGPSPLIVASR